MGNKSDKAKQYIEKRSEAHKQSVKPRKQETRKVFNVSGHNILERSTGKKKTYEVYQSGKLVGKADSLYGAEHIADARYSNQKKSESNIAKRPPLRKNVSQSIPNGTLIITNDRNFSGTDGNSDKTRMATVVDSNRKNELALTKYTTSKKHGRTFNNDKGFNRHGDTIYTKDNEDRPIVLDNDKFIKGSERRTITQEQANEIKRRNVKESKYKKTNKVALRELKGRQKNKDR